MKSLPISKKTPVSSWGKLSAYPHNILHLSSPDDSISQLQQSLLPGIPYGMGRSYGDVCLNPNGTIWKTNLMDHFITFDDVTGILRCESGVLIGDIQYTLIPRGWCLPVTPGTQFVTVGGAIANDVHGKNHHVKGSFGNHVLNIKLARTDGEIINCTPNENRDWFEATVGGLGLTGVILETQIQLVPVASPWLEIETIVYSGINEFLEISDSSEKGWEYTVSWVDCLSGKHLRGIFIRGNSVQLESTNMSRRKAFSMPINPPFSWVNKLSLRPLNFLYYQFQKMKSGRSISHYKQFFYPLDSIHQWNRMYGPKGFYQYQMVVPRSEGSEAIERIFKLISQSGQGTFLVVLKTFGDKESLGMLSFPQPGVTLALDFPNMGQKTLSLLEQLDNIVLEAKGRLYPAKDARMSASLFRAGYSRLEEFERFRDPGISSSFSKRVMGN